LDDPAQDRLLDPTHHRFAALFTEQTVILQDNGFVAVPDDQSLLIWRIASASDLLHGSLGNSLKLSPDGCFQVVGVGVFFSHETSPPLHPPNLVVRLKGRLECLPSCIHAQALKASDDANVVKYQVV
jgi:hypothetical protein